MGIKIKITTSTSTISEAFGIDDARQNEVDELTDQAWDDCDGKRLLDFIQRSIELIDPKTTEELALLMFYCGRMAGARL